MARRVPARQLISSIVVIISLLMAIVPSSSAAREISPEPGSLTVAAACSPRPPVKVDVTAGSEGQLQVTITAGAPPVRELRFGPASNALLDLPGAAPGSPGSQVVTLPASSSQYTFTVRRVGSDQGSTVPLVVVDGCGDWPTFVGGGTGAWKAGISGRVTTMPDDAPIVSAVVRLDPENLVTMTDSRGSFSFEQAPVGSHTLRAAAIGFGEDSRPVSLSAGETTRVTVGLTALAPTIPPPAGATASIRVKATWDDGTTPAGDGVIIRLDGTEIGTTNAAGLLTTRYPPGEYSLDAVIPSLARGAATVRLTSGQLTDVAVALDGNGEVTEPGDLVLDELVNGGLPLDTRSITLRFMRNGAPVVMQQVSEVELSSTNEGFETQDLTDQFGLSAQGTIAATGLASVIAALRSVGNDATLSVSAQDARGFSYADSISFTPGVFRLDGQLVAPPTLPVGGLTVKVQIGEQPAQSLTTDASGAFRLNQVPRGPVQIVATTERDGWSYTGLASFTLALDTRVGVRLLGGADLLARVPPFELNGAATAGRLSRADLAGQLVAARSRVAADAPGIVLRDPDLTANTFGSAHNSATFWPPQVGDEWLPRGTNLLAIGVSGGSSEIDKTMLGLPALDPGCSADLFAGPAPIYHFAVNQLEAFFHWPNPVLQGGFYSWLHPVEIVDVSALTRDYDAAVTVTSNCEYLGVPDSYSTIHMEAAIVGADFRVEKVLRDKVLKTNGHHDHYSIPRPGQSNYYQRKFDVVYSAPRYMEQMRLKVELVDEHERLLETIMDDLLDNLVQARRVERIDQPSPGRTLRVTVTFDPKVGNTPLINSQPPPADKIRYRFTLRGTVGDQFGKWQGIALPDEQPNGEQTQVVGRGGQIFHRGQVAETDPKLSDISYALWRMPDGFRRYGPENGPRDKGLDDWAAQRTYIWLDANRDLVTRINDISGEHAYDLGHLTHTKGTDIDMFHVYTFPGGAASGDANYQRLKEQVSRALAGDVQARGRVNEWAVATRERFDRLLGDAQVRQVIYMYGTVYQPQLGNQLGPLFPRLGMGWARDLLRTGRYTSPDGVVLVLPAGELPNGQNLAMVFDNKSFKHENHFHVTLR